MSVRGTCVCRRAGAWGRRWPSPEDEGRPQGGGSGSPDSGSDMAGGGRALQGSESPPVTPDACHGVVSCAVVTGEKAGRQ